MSKVTVREAALLVSRSRETINEATKEGKLSFTLDGRNRKVIDVSELERVYPLVKTMAGIQQSGSVSPDQDLTANSPSDLKEQLAMLRERVNNLTSEGELLKSERERERQQLTSEIEHLRSSLEKAQEQGGKAMLLLTDQSRDEEGRKQEQRAKIETLERSVLVLKKHHRKLLEEIQERKSQERKSQGFWQRLLG